MHKKDGQTGSRSAQHGSHSLQRNISLQRGFNAHAGHQWSARRGGLLTCEALKAMLDSGTDVRRSQSSSGCELKASAEAFPRSTTEAG